MISFVWSSKYPFLSGTGGSENYTAGQIRELHRRGIPARILTLGHGQQDGRENFPDIEFKNLESKEELSKLDDIIVFVTYPLDVRTKHPAYAILHCPPPTFAHGDVLYNRKAFNGKRLIATSRFAAGLWRRYLGLNTGKIHTVYPFAVPAFAEVERAKTPAPNKLLFASRLTVDKGIYTLLAALHMENLKDRGIELTVTDAGAQSDDGKIILQLLRAHPNVRVIPARKSPQEMAELLAEFPVVVMPTTDIFWKETFGMVSVEAQHAGCRVVASRTGGLPETNIGGMVQVKADDPKSLALGLGRALNLGPLPAAERRRACQYFTVQSSVNDLLSTINYHHASHRQLHPAPSLLTPQLQTPLPRAGVSLPSRLTSSGVPLFGNRLR